MSCNREHRGEYKSVDILMGLRRKQIHGEYNCIRVVDRGLGNELQYLRNNLKSIGGDWRIHKTVNARDVEKARIYLLKLLIEYPDKAGNLESEWKTSLLQPHCIYGDKKFMLDVDTQKSEEVDIIFDRVILGGVFISKHKTPKGWHIITKPFDTREILSLPNVTLLRDGYYFVEELKEEKE
jgi:hypothetical protein